MYDCGNDMHNNKTLKHQTAHAEPWRLAVNKNEIVCALLILPTQPNLHLTIFHTHKHLTHLICSFHLRSFSDHQKECLLMLMLVLVLVLRPCA